MPPRSDRRRMPPTIRLHDLEFAELLSAGAIATRVGALGALGAQLRARFAARHRKPGERPRPPLFAAVLRGAAVFHADLIRAYDGELEIGFVRTSSYAGTESSGEVAIDIPDGLGLAGRDIVLVEDIADSGRTLRVLAQALRARGVASLTTVVLLDKPSQRVVEVDVDLAGFTIGPDFVVGYGLDYDGLGRNLPAIYAKVG